VHIKSLHIIIIIRNFTAIKSCLLRMLSVRVLVCVVCHNGLFIELIATRALHGQRRLHAAAIEEVVCLSFSTASLRCRPVQSTRLIQFPAGQSLTDIIEFFHCATDRKRDRQRVPSRIGIIPITRYGTPRIVTTPSNNNDQLPNDSFY